MQRRCFMSVPIILALIKLAQTVFLHHTRNSSGDEIANVNFLYDDIVHVDYYKIQ